MAAIPFKPRHYATTWHSTTGILQFSSKPEIPAEGFCYLETGTAGPKNCSETDRKERGLTLFASL